MVVGEGGWKENVKTVFRLQINENTDIKIAILVHGHKWESEAVRVSWSQLGPILHIGHDHGQLPDELS